MTRDEAFDKAINHELQFSGYLCDSHLPVPGVDHLPGASADPPGGGGRAGLPLHSQRESAPPLPAPAVSGRVQSSELRVQRSEFRVQGTGFRVQRSEFRVQGSEFRVQGSEVRVQSSGFRVQGSEFRVQGSGFRVQSSGFRVQSSGFRVQGSGFRVQSSGRCVFYCSGKR